MNGCGIEGPTFSRNRSSARQPSDEDFEIRATIHPISHDKATSNDEKAN
jgi:hypothetical protein